MTSNYDDIPDYEPLPDEGGGRGPGFTIEDEMPKIKVAEIVDEDIAVVGYLILPNGFKEKETDPDEYMLIEIIDVAGEHKLFNTMSNALMKTVQKRHERGEFPFKTSVQVKLSKNKRNYYVFA